MRHHKDIHKAGTIEYVAVLLGAPKPEDDYHQPTIYTTKPIESLDAAKKAAQDALVNYPTAVAAEVNKTVWGDSEIIVHDGEEILWVDDDTEIIEHGDCDDGEIHWEKY